MVVEDMAHLAGLMEIEIMEIATMDIVVMVVVIDIEIIGIVRIVVQSVYDHAPEIEIVAAILTVVAVEIMIDDKKMNNSYGI